MLDTEDIWSLVKMREIYLNGEIDSVNSLSDELLRDPVCGKIIKAPKYAGAMVIDGNIKYYFCSMECKTKFLKEPEKYLSENVN